MKTTNLKKVCFSITKITTILFTVALLVTCKTRETKEASLIKGERKHVKVFYEEGKYGGWPANGGAWNWGNEILVGFTVGNHQDSAKISHPLDRETAFAKFSRSLDGGLTWSLEDAYKKGITESTFEHKLGEKSEEATFLSEDLDFTNPDFAMTFRTRDLLEGPSSFYYTNNRGNLWRGPYKIDIDFLHRTPTGIVSRTDYIIDSKNEMTAFLTVGFHEGDKNWREVACVRTTDGGKTWKHLSWIGEEKINSIMPSSLRLSPSRLLSIIRRTKPPRMVSFLSENNGKTWNQMDDPVTVDSNGNPPALLRLKNNRLCLVYGIRKQETMPDGIGMYIAYSDDEGQTWSAPELLRGKDGAVWDIGYPRAVLLPDGTAIALYYYNNASNGNKYRYIAATIFEP